MTRFRVYGPAALVIIGVLMLAVAYAAWRPPPGPAVQLWTGGNGLCYLSNTRGELVADKTAGVAIIERSTGNPDRATPIEWPDGYTGRQSGADVEVLDAKGQVVARTGTRVEMQGGYGERGFLVCGLTTLDGRPLIRLLP